MSLPEPLACQPYVVHVYETGEHYFDVRVSRHDWTPADPDTAKLLVTSFVEDNLNLGEALVYERDDKHTDDYFVFEIEAW